MKYSALIAITTWALSVQHVRSVLTKLDVPFVAKDPTEVPVPLPRSHFREEVDVHLEIQEVITEIEPGKKSWVWTFNGTVPGPMIRVREGDTVNVHLTNHEENMRVHNIDLHAVLGPGGGGDATVVAPNETTTLSFKATREGTYKYHCAAPGAPWDHVGYGMFGLILVEPLRGLPTVDKEFYLGQSDWYHGEIDPALSADFGEDVYVLSTELAEEEHPTMYSFNGHKSALVDGTLFGSAFTSQQGETVRIFFVNAGPNVGSNFHVIGGIFDKVCAGDFRKSCIENEETVYIPPGSALAVDMWAPVPGTYLLVDHALYRAKKGALGLWNVQQTEEWPLDIYGTDLSQS